MNDLFHEQYADIHKLIHLVFLKMSVIGNIVFTRFLMSELIIELSRLRFNSNVRTETVADNILQNQSQRESFENIHIHRTEIHQYRKQKGRQSIVLQSAVEYIHALKENGKLIGGSEERKEQAKYNVELVYIQDQDMVENQEDAGLALNCPNCGAPLPGLGAKKCIYCDTPIVEYNLRIWNFSRVEEA